MAIAMADGCSRGCWRRWREPRPQASAPKLYLNRRPEWCEVGVLVEHIDTFAALQEIDHEIGDRCQDHLPAHLEHPLRDQHLEDESCCPSLRPEKGERI